MLPLDENGIYSVDRLNCKSFKDWTCYLAKPERVHGDNGIMSMNVFEKGARLLHLGRDGFIPIGFFNCGIRLVQASFLTQQNTARLTEQMCFLLITFRVKTDI